MWEPRRAVQATLTLRHLDPQAKERLNQCERKWCQPEACTLQDDSSNPLFGVILQGPRLLGWAELG